MIRNMPATVGMPLEEVETPCLIIDLDAFERNVATMAHFVKQSGVRLRAHAKTHKSADIARYQIEKGGACGICCQKVSEAEALVDAGIGDVLVSNEVISPKKIERLCRMASRARVLVCVDDRKAVETLSSAASSFGISLECLVEIDVGAERCGVRPGKAAVELARAVAAARGLRFAGLQAYQGRAQHVCDFAERKALIDAAVKQTAETVRDLASEGLECKIVGGAGTGSYRIESASGVYNELQCGSYVFMDVDYGRVRDEDGRPMADFENSLFVLTSVMSKAKPGKAVCDAGLKALSVDCGMPAIFGRSDLEYVNCSDEHGGIADPANVLKLDDRLKLVPGHCDPTVNLYDWYVCTRGGRVEGVWPVTARGMVL